MKFSVIVPIYNEKDSIHSFLDSLYSQTRTPDEIIIVDWGSTDWTFEILKKEEKKWKIRLLSNPVRQWNIARSRNLAIENSSYDLILCTDAWNQLNKNRCEAYLKIYETTDEKVVWGKSEFIADTKFQKNCIPRLTSKVPNFPSRNVSFYKQARKDAGWYPEFLTLWAEDTYFNNRLKDAWYSFYYCKDAIVKRELRKNYYEIYKMYRNYTQWDTEVLIVKWKNQSISIKQSIIFVSFFLCLFLSIFVLKWWIIPVIILWLIAIWLYKRTPWWFWFDLHFSCAKIVGITIGFLKWIISGIKIRYKMKKEK